MTRGPKPSPTVLKLLKGNPGKRPINKDEPTPTPVRKPKPPIELDPSARKEWRRVVGELDKLGMVSKLDVSVLAAYCVSFSRFKAANEALKVVSEKDPAFHGMLIKTKQGNWIQNPLVGVARRAAADMAQFASEFGMTPSSRTRVRAVSQSSENEWDEL